MEQLINLVQDRFRRAKQVQQKEYESQQLRSLKEQQKQRCQKQSWILAMIRLNKSVSLSLKNNYLAASYKIMKIIDPNFSHSTQQPNLEENFLNQFVYLYRHFFDRYEAQLNFKISIRSLLRPTNHNIINDMLKYLIDFSRDYYQQTFIWKMKMIKQNEFQQKIQSVQMFNETARDSQSNIFMKNNDFKQKKRRTLNNFSKFSIFQIRNSRNLIGEQISRKKFQVFKNYDILDIANVPSFACIEKQKSNLQYLRNKVNQVYKQNRYRNAEMRLSFNNYLSNHPNLRTKQYCNSTQISGNDMMTYPFKFTLAVEKNGFSSIQIALSAQLNFINFTKNTRYTNFQASSSFNKADYLINSMRVLRVSENFHPNFMSAKDNIDENNVKDQNLPIINIVNTERLTNYGGNQSKQQTQLKKKSSMTYIKIMGRNELQKIDRQNQVKRDCESAKVQQSNNEIKKQCNGISKQYIPQKKFSSKVFSIRKHYPSQEKVRLNSNHKNVNNNDLPQQKLLKWLQKMKFAKDMQRRKILGLH